MPVDGPILAQGHQGSTGQSDKAVFAAFTTANVYAVAFGIDIGDGETEGLAQPEAHGIGGQEERTLAGLLRGGEDPGNLGGSPNILECELPRLPQCSLRSSTVSRSGHRSKYSVIRRRARL